MIGIFGGTFDPIHNGHIQPALSIKQALALSQLRFIPNRVPPHREIPWLSVDERLALLHSALSGFSDVIIDERELNRDGPSYMVDTLNSLKTDYPEEDLCLIIGMDVFFDISSWYQWRSIFELCQIVVTTRPGFNQKQIQSYFNVDDYQFIEQKITKDINAFSTQESSRETAKILLQSVPQLDISSTQIRDKLSAGEDISQWMPLPAYKKLRGFIDDN